MWPERRAFFKKRLWNDGCLTCRQVKSLKITQLHKKTNQQQKDQGNE